MNNSSLSRVSDPFFRLAPNPMWVAAEDGFLNSVNPAFVRSSGYEEDALLSRPFSELVHPEDRRNVTTALRRLNNDMAQATFECRLRCNQASYRWFRWRVESQEGTHYGCGEDITEEKAAAKWLVEEQKSEELELRVVRGDPRVDQDLIESEALFRAISEQMPDMLFLLDGYSTPPGRILHANQVTCEKHGYSLEELLRLSVHQLIDEDGGRQIPGLLERLKHGESLTFEGIHQHRDGGQFPVEVQATEIVFGHRRGILAIVRDLTHRNRERQVRQRLENKIQQKRKLQSLGALAGGIAHDFNNLLVGVLGNAGLLLEDHLAGTSHHDMLLDIETAAQRASDLCRKMLSYAGKLPLEMRSLQLGDLIVALRPEVEATAGDNTLWFNISPDLPSILGDAAQIEQVLLSLVSNAADALGSEGGEIAVIVTPRRADVAQLAGSVLARQLPVGEHVCLAVSDTGCGMDARTMARIFDPFFSTKFAGRGLGMAAVLGIVHGHGGVVLVDSEPGHGSTLEVLFPAEASAEP